MGPDDFARKLRQLRTNLFDSRFKSDLGMKIRMIIYNRTKSGLMLSSDNTPAESTRLVRMKPLSESYKLQRGGRVEFTTNDGKKVSFRIKAPRLGRFGAPSRSNLTFTGQMLESLNSIVRGDVINIDVSNTGRRDTDLTNKEIADLVSEDRPFLGLSASELRLVERIIQKHIDDLVIRYLT